MEHRSKALSAGLILSLIWQQFWLRKPDIFLLGAFLDIFYSSSMSLTVTGTSVVLILTLEEQYEW